jgi:predicted metal-dependent hydrolase
VRLTPHVAKLRGGDLPFTLRQSAAKTRGVSLSVTVANGLVVSAPATETAAHWAERAQAFIAANEYAVRKMVATTTAAKAEGRVEHGGSLLYRGARLPLVIKSGARTDVMARSDAIELTRAPGERRSDSAILRAWFIAQADDVMRSAVRVRAAMMNVRPGSITMRDTRGKWGSANTRTGNLNFSWRLLCAPPDVLDTAVVHELAHLIVPNHSRKFWLIVASFRPDHSTQQTWLNNHGDSIHGMLSA